MSSSAGRKDEVGVWPASRANSTKGLMLSNSCCAAAGGRGGSQQAEASQLFVLHPGIVSGLWLLVREQVMVTPWYGQLHTLSVDKRTHSGNSIHMSLKTKLLGGR